MISPPVKFLVESVREKGLLLGLTTGCFDLIHINHIRFIQEAASECARLFVAVNSDRSTKILKGEGRPIVPEAERLEIVCAIKGVYSAFIFDDTDPCEVIQEVAPNLFFKGKEREGTELPESHILANLGARLRFVGPHKDRSTSDLLARIKASV